MKSKLIYLIPFAVLIPLLSVIIVSQKTQEVIPVSTKSDYSQNQPNKFIPSPTPKLQPEYIPDQPTIEKIFSPDHSWTATLSAAKKVTLVATGDIIPARTVNYQATVRNNFKWPFENTALLLKSADITLINLESPLIPNCPLTNSGMVFCGSQKHIEGLNLAGVDIANLANNHTGNYGTDGVNKTKDLLLNSNILVTGLSNVAEKTIKGVRFAFLGFNALEDLDEAEISQQIAQAKSRTDILIVSFHWGAEYRDLPDAKQIKIAHLAVDSGADLIVGNHPHWIQPVEIYNKKFIAYAHGNFVFDQMWSEKTKEGVVGIYTFFGNKLVDIQYIPIVIKDYGQPYFPNVQEGQKIIDGMKAVSEKLSTDH